MSEEQEIVQEAMRLVSTELTREGREPRRLARPIETNPLLQPGVTAHTFLPPPTRATSLLSRPPDPATAVSPSLEMEAPASLRGQPGGQAERAVRGRGLGRGETKGKGGQALLTCPVQIEPPHNPLLAQPPPELFLKSHFQKVEGKPFFTSFCGRFREEPGRRKGPWGTGRGPGASVSSGPARCMRQKQGAPRGAASLHRAHLGLSPT